jgi:aspartate racemase
MIVDHDPTIPDRTACLPGEGTDPTASILAACKCLEAYGADLIAIPCNTAHIEITCQPGDTLAFKDGSCWAIRSLPFC